MYLKTPKTCNFSEVRKHVFSRKRYLPYIVISVHHTMLWREKSMSKVRELVISYYFTILGIKYTYKNIPAVISNLAGIYMGSFVTYMFSSSDFSFPYQFSFMNCLFFPFWPGIRLIIIWIHYFFCTHLIKLHAYNTHNLKHILNRKNNKNF